MKIDFSQEHPSEQAIKAHYKFLVDTHMQCEKQYAEQEFIYLKYAGFFVLASVALMIMHGKGLVSNYLIGVVFVGIGVLCASALSIIFIHSNADWKLAKCTEEGTALEEKYAHAISSCYFRTTTAVKPRCYRISIISRLGPFCFVGICTVLAGVALSIKISFTLGVFLSIASALLLIASQWLLFLTIKKTQTF